MRENSIQDHFLISIKLFGILLYTIFYALTFLGFACLSLYLHFHLSALMLSGLFSFLETTSATSFALLYLFVLFILAFLVLLAAGAMVAVLMFFVAKAFTAFFKHPLNLLLG
jgi:hypothetical protein